MYSIYSYPVDASCSSHYARDDIKSYIFFWALSSMETIVVSAGWLVFISILTILNQLEIKIRINNNKAITAYSIRNSTTSHCLFWMKMLLALWSNLLFFSSVFFSLIENQADPLCVYLISTFITWDFETCTLQSFKLLMVTALFTRYLFLSHYKKYILRS